MFQILLWRDAANAFCEVFAQPGSSANIFASKSFWASLTLLIREFSGLFFAASYCNLLMTNTWRVEKSITERSTSEKRITQQGEGGLCEAGWIDFKSYASAG